MLMGLLMLLCVACNKSEKETPSGLKFKIVKAGDGITPKVGEVIVFKFVFKDSKDSVWRDSYKSDMPQSAVIADTAAIKTEDGMMQMLRMLSKGDSAIVDISLKEFFEKIAKSPIPPTFDTTLFFHFDVKIDSITTREKMMKFQAEWSERKYKEQLEIDEAIIDKYLSEKNIVAQKTESGLRYVITKPGNGENGKSGQTVKAYYTGYTLEGVYFDGNIKSVAQEKGFYNPAGEPYAPYEVTIDRPGIIKGWYEAFKVLNKGAKATVYIPSVLAYGPQGRGEVIKANEILVFDLEVVDLK